MKIVDRKAFLALPQGTLFAKYKPHVFGEVRIKGESLENDWWDSGLVDIDEGDKLWPDAMDEALERREFALELDCQSRDGQFDEDQLFAVFEHHDVEALIQRLQRALSDSTAGAATAHKGNP